MRGKLDCFQLLAEELNAGFTANQVRSRCLSSPFLGRCLSSPCLCRYLCSDGFGPSAGKRM